MNFSSPVFIFLFLPFVFFSYFLIPKFIKNLWLVIVSLLFYGWTENNFILFIIGWSLINYKTGLKIETSNKKKFWFIISILINLGVLFYFKYWNFFFLNIFSLVNSSFQLRETFLPLAISFFTFHAISYNFDIYREINKSERNLIRFFLYILFFPHLIAGPIIRYHIVSKQLIYRKISISDISYGVSRFIIGLAKKVIIADTLSHPVDEIFAIDPLHLTSSEAWVGVLMFSLQIYYDFSGYTDMAIGLARIFGFTFPENFNYPYVSSSITEFWRRWHITLSNWFRDYLYIPLGGNKVSSIRNNFNIAVVFILTGLWHGDNWTFVVWGAIHGTFRVIENFKGGKSSIFLVKPLRYLYTLLVINLSWVFFRSNDLSQALSYFQTLFAFNNNRSVIYRPLEYFITNDLLVVLSVALVFVFPLYPYLSKLILKVKKRLNKCKYLMVIFTRSVTLIYYIMLLFLSFLIIASQTYRSFIYFKF